MGDQAAEAAPPHRLPFDAPQDAVDEMRDLPKDLNPLEIVDAEFKLLVQALRDGISLQDFDYDWDVQHITSETLWDLVDPPLCKDCKEWKNGAYAKHTDMPKPSCTPQLLGLHFDPRHGFL